MKIYQLTYTDKNLKCTTIAMNPKRYYVMTDNKMSAVNKGNELLAEEKHADRYKLSLAKLIEAHDV